MSAYVDIEAHRIMRNHNDLLRNQNGLLERIATALETIADQGRDDLIHLKD